MTNTRRSIRVLRPAGGLPALRRQIDKLDERMLALLNARARMAQQIGRIKHRKQWPVYDAKREAFVLRHVTQQNQGPLSPAAVRHVFQSILTECRRRQRRRPRPTAGRGTSVATPREARGPRLGRRR